MAILQLLPELCCIESSLKKQQPGKYRNPLINPNRQIYAHDHIVVFPNRERKFNNQFNKKSLAIQLPGFLIYQYGWIFKV